MFEPVGFREIQIKLNRCINPNSYVPASHADGSTHTKVSGVLYALRMSKRFLASRMIDFGLVVRLMVPQ